jgi:hypothetical protein
LPLGRRRAPGTRLLIFAAQRVGRRGQECVEISPMACPIALSTPDGGIVLTRHIAISPHPSHPLTPLPPFHRSQLGNGCFKMLNKGAGLPPSLDAGLEGGAGAFQGLPALSKAAGPSAHCPSSKGTPTLKKSRTSITILAKRWASPARGLATGLGDFCRARRSTWRRRCALRFASTRTRRSGSTRTRRAADTRPGGGGAQALDADAAALRGCCARSRRFGQWQLLRHEHACGQGPGSTRPRT